MVKIFHTGDIHLDSQFHKLGYEERLRAREHQRDIFKKMIKYVSDNAFDILLISGDLFDGRKISPETEECVIEAFSSLACKIFISPGNHDPYAVTAPYFRGKLPENVYVFNSSEIQVQTLSELGVQICGYAFMSSNIYSEHPLASFTLPEFDGASILCAHGELNISNSRFAPIMESEIAGCGFDFAALGHVHTAEIKRCGDSVIAYCGVIEGRAFDELGECGGIEVFIDGKSVTRCERVLFSEKKFVEEAVDVSEAADREGLADYLADFLAEKGYDKSVAVRLTLDGAVDIGFSYDKTALEKLLSDRLMLVEISDKTFPRIDVSLLESDYTLRGEVYRALRSEIESEDAETRRIALEALKVSLLAIDGRSIR